MVHHFLGDVQGDDKHHSLEPFSLTSQCCTDRVEMATQHKGTGGQKLTLVLQQLENFIFISELVTEKLYLCISSCMHIMYAPVFVTSHKHL